METDDLTFFYYFFVIYQASFCLVLVCGWLLSTYIQKKHLRRDYRFTVFIFSILPIINTVVTMKYLILLLYDLISNEDKIKKTVDDMIKNIEETAAALNSTSIEKTKGKNE